MRRRILAAVALCWGLLLRAECCRAQTTDILQSPVTKRVEAPPHRILEKDPEYRKLLDPPTGDEFLQTYSEGYRGKSAEIEARAANLGDEKLRARYRSDEWSYVPKKTMAQFKAEADVAYNQAKISFLRNHRDAWFEIGQVKYDDVLKAFLVKTLSGATVEANVLVAVSPDKRNQIYEKFLKVAEPEMDEKTRAYVSHAGAGSMCGSNPEWCYSVKRDDVEQSVRAERLIMVGQGDVEARRIDRLLLVDYVTETVFQEFDPHLSGADTLVWRMSTEVPPLIPSRPPEPTEAAAPVPTTLNAEAPAISSPASAAPAPAASVPVRDAGAGNHGGESAPKPISSLIPAVPVVRRPVKVTAAAIVDQPPPQYPEQARAKNIQGQVILRALIGKDGSVSDARVLSGDNLLAPSAVEAVQHWKYKPMLVDGVPTETQTTITVTFSLNE